MQIHVFDNPTQVGKATATLFAAQILRAPRCVLGLATGSSPIPAYQELIALYKAGVLDFSGVTSFNLDEYIGIPEDHPCSYHAFMRQELFSGVNMNASRVHVPNGNSADMAAECAAYDAAIVKAGGIDMQLLGIGRNGHIGFNEPSNEFVYGCHVVDLTESTISANRRFFDSEAQVPRKAVSLGIGSIMNARAIVLIATGADKAEAVKQSIRGDITPAVQASILRTHPNVFMMLDKAAAGLL